MDLHETRIVEVKKDDETTELEDLIESDDTDSELLSSLGSSARKRTGVGNSNYSPNIRTFRKDGALYLEMDGVVRQQPIHIYNENINTSDMFTGQVISLATNILDSFASISGEINSLIAEVNVAIDEHNKQIAQEKEAEMEQAVAEAEQNTQNG